MAASHSEVEQLLQTHLDRALREREELTRALREREALLHMVQEVSPTGLVLYRARRDERGTLVDFDLVYQNEAASRLNGFPSGSQDDRKLTMRVMFPDIEHTPFWRAHCQVVETGEPTRTEDYYRAPQYQGWFRISRTRPAHDYLSIAFDDITEERLAREAQREEALTNESLLRVARAISGFDLAAIVQAVTDEATTVCRAEFGAFFYNMADEVGESYMLYTLSGVPRSAFEKFPMPRNTAVFGPTFAGKGVVRADDITKSEHYGLSEPYRGMPPGHLPVRSYLAVPVVSRTGEVLGGLFFGHSQVGVFGPRDEHTVVAIAQQAAVAMDSARLFELAQQERAKAEDASRMKDDFLATISHELRTPLQSILGWTHMLRRGALEGPAGQRALEAVERNAKAQAALIEDILDVSRIIAGKLRIEVAPVSLAEVVSAALDTVRPAADAKQVRLTALVDPEASPVMGDEHRLQQVAWNLLSNAVKFSRPGGWVEVAVRSESDAVVVTVRDDGQGIPADFLPHVFDRFRQLDASITRKSAGLGLGLSIVKHVVELHGGSVLAESAGEGLGATFSVRIPSVARSQPSETPRGSSFATMPPGTPGTALVAGLRILVVDDEEDARELLHALLVHEKAEVRTASSSREAFALLREDPPDVLLSDIGMPEEDGYTLIERVRALPASEGGRTPAVALTAYARSEDRTRSLRKGFNHHVAKPVDAQELLAAIANLMGRFSS
jgi:signal transduction histidine kinase